jgi:hypothetical protein
MKKLVLFMAVILFSGITFGQTLKKGNLIGTHVISVDLQPGVTMDKFIEFVNTKLAPEVEKYYIGWKVYLVKGIRGENPDSYGLIYVINSEEDRDKLYNPDGSLNEMGTAVNAKIQPVLDEMAKLGTFTTKYTDWIVLY